MLLFLEKVRLKVLMLLMLLLLPVAAHAQWENGPDGTWDFDGSDVDTFCDPLDNQGTLIIGNGTATTGNFSNGGTGVTQGGTGQLIVAGSFSNSGVFNAQSGTVILNANAGGCAIAAPHTFTGDTTFNNLQILTDTTIAGGTVITVNGTLTIPAVVQLTAGAGGNVTINAQNCSPSTLFSPSVNIICGRAAGAMSIPTLGDWAMAALMLMLMFVAGVFFRKNGKIKIQH